MKALTASNLPLLRVTPQAKATLRAAAHPSRSTGENRHGRRPVSLFPHASRPLPIADGFIQDVATHARPPFLPTPSWVNTQPAP
jgi:hypothetical protein